MATISSPIGRTPRNAGAGANTYKKGGTTKVAGVMGKGGAKYQDKGAVTKSRTVTKGPLGLTKTIVKTKTYADKDPVVTTKTRNTVKGALNNVAAKLKRPPVGGFPMPVPGNSIPIILSKKKGGVIKKKK